MIYMGIDPGGTTGIAILTPDKFMTMQIHALDVMPFMRGWVDGLVDLGVANDVHIGIEKFIAGSDTHKKSHQPAAVELTHQIREYAGTRGCWVRLHGAGLSKNYGDDILRKIGAYGAGRNHSNDATRVVLVTVLLEEPRLLQQIMIHGVPKPDDAELPNA